MLTFLPHDLGAQPLPAAGGSGREPASCEAAIAALEAGSGLPPGLLLAIARAESGRPDPLTRRVAPWPWAVNAGGIGAYPATREAAMGLVRTTMAGGVLSVDVGCMQINLRHHPGAFASLEDAFDPRANVAYAIRFLTSLRARHGDWAGAIGSYHSGDSIRGADYLRRVNAAWGGVSVVPGPAPAVVAVAFRPPNPSAARGGPSVPSTRPFTPAPIGAGRAGFAAPAAFRSAPPFAASGTAPRRG